MQTIHENHMTVPSLYSSRNSSPGLSLSSRFSSRTPSPGGSDDSMRNSQGMKGQRRSEGTLDFTGIIRGNTWPYRSSLPSGQFASSHDLGGHSATIPRQYNKNGNTSGGRYVMNTGYPSTGNSWGCPEPRYRPWVTKSLPSSQG